MVPWLIKLIRRAALGLGITTLLWLPPSFLVGISIILPWPGAYSSFTLSSGALAISSRQDNPFIQFDSAHASIYRVQGGYRNLARALWPSFQQSQFPAGPGIATQTDIRLPLWLLALLCLAWPVTRFILLRRDPRRGFAVEPRTILNLKSEI